MLKPHHLLLVVSLLQDGGVDTSVTASSPSAARAPEFRADAGGVDAGNPGRAVVDGGSARKPIIAEGIQWPEDLQPLATLDGPAVLAAHAVMQRVLSGYPKQYATSCAFSAKGLEVIVGEERGMYFVRIQRGPDKCGWALGTVLGFDEFELYAVSPEGKILARYPYHP
ncbi:hypothetical protein OV207_10085 [Corallococcus sp. BB11-1]|uniref:hypothetical protein n=1 Tax=Corallococcus sp. BB11-1 TaxID=2996783 RepID=UPI0022719E71|nr:hypothetical protein [Corallococcus sp. BB11-1]MCY1031803.1 hypothetical protein [Corallococcus sp. BB11-1]